MSRRARPWYRGARSMWYVTHAGKQTPLGVTDPADRAGADAAHQRLIADLAAGIAAKLAPPGPPPAAACPTAADAVAAFVAAAGQRVAKGKLTAESLANYRQQLEHFAADFGPRPVTALTAEELEEWAAGREWSASYQHNTLGTVGQVLRAAGVVLKIKRPPKESRGADSVLTDEQFARVLREVVKYPGARGDLPELLTALRETGGRPQELAALHVAGVDWENACTLLQKHKTRRHTGKARVIHFTAAAMAVLARQRGLYGEGLLFRTRYGNAYDAKTIVDRLLGVSKRLGFRVIAYGLGRHSFATRALTAGVPDVLVAGLLGHTGTAMVHAHYSHVDQQARALKDAAERVSRTRAG